METVVSSFFFHNWQRKSVAILTAIILWFFVSHSIQETKIIANVPIRIINLPPDKTILGILPNGILSKRITLTLTGTKDIVEELESGDVEVLLDASLANSDLWIVQISKKNLVSLNPSIDLANHISNVNHSDFVIKLSHLVTAKIPITIEPPIGSAPQGYEYLDIWPSTLTQTLSGPEEEIQVLKEKGLKLTFDLREVTKSELDAIKGSTQNLHNDEISFPVPHKWKQIAIPFHNNHLEEINDPEAQNLRIDFLRKEFLPIGNEIPIRVFYPLNESSSVNPENFMLASNEEIQKKNGISVLAIPLFARDVSHLFIDIIKNYLEIVIVSSPKQEREILEWSLEFINPKELEDMYVAYSLGNFTLEKNASPLVSKKREELLRKRFSDYMRRLTLYTTAEHKLQLKSTIDGDQIRVNLH